MVEMKGVLHELECVAFLSPFSVVLAFFPGHCKILESWISFGLRS